MVGQQNVKKLSVFTKTSFGVCLQMPLQNLTIIFWRIVKRRVFLARFTLQSITFLFWHTLKNTPTRREVCRIKSPIREIEVANSQRMVINSWIVCDVSVSSRLTSLSEEFSRHMVQLLPRGSIFVHTCTVHQSHWLPSTHASLDAAE